MNKNLKLTAASPLSSWLDYLESLHPKNIDLSLERLEPIAHRYQLIKPAPYIFTVSGTNGKGSTCAMIAQTLLASGYKVGVYSSPHILHFEERVRINGRIVSSQDFCSAFEQIEKWRGEQLLTFFEFVTLAALFLFKEAHLDALILEVGLGGRFDATNIVDHDLSIVTSVALDHLAFLGADLEKIGYEKAGIFRAGKPALCAQIAHPKSVENYAKEIESPFYSQGSAFYYQRGCSLEDQTTPEWNWFCNQKLCYEHLPIPSIHLDNASVALMALHLSPFVISHIILSDTLKSIQVPGRFQRLSIKPDLYIDVAHNPHSVSYLATCLRQLKIDKNCHIHAIVGMMADKDIKTSLKSLDGVIDYWYPAGFIDLPRAATGLQIKEILLSHAICSENCLVFDSVIEAYQMAIVQATTDDVIIAFGSFHVVEQMLFTFKQDVV